MLNPRFDVSNVELERSRPDLNYSMFPGDLVGVGRGNKEDGLMVQFLYVQTTARGGKSFRQQHCRVGSKSAKFSPSQQGKPLPNDVGPVKQVAVTKLVSHGDDIERSRQIGVFLTAKGELMMHPKLGIHGRYAKWSLLSKERDVPVSLVAVCPVNEDNTALLCLGRENGVIEVNRLRSCQVEGCEDIEFGNAQLELIWSICVVRDDPDSDDDDGDSSPRFFGSLTLRKTEDPKIFQVVWSRNRRVGMKVVYIDPDGESEEDCEVCQEELPHRVDLVRPVRRGEGFLELLCCGGGFVSHVRFDCARNASVIVKTAVVIVSPPEQVDHETETEGEGEVETGSCIIQKVQKGTEILEVIVFDKSKEECLIVVAVNDPDRLWVCYLETLEFGKFNEEVKIPALPRRSTILKCWCLDDDKTAGTENDSAVPSSWMSHCVVWAMKIRGRRRRAGSRRRLQFLRIVLKPERGSVPELSFETINLGIKSLRFSDSLFGHWVYYDAMWHQDPFTSVPIAVKVFDDVDLASLTAQSEGSIIEELREIAELQGIPELLAVIRDDQDRFVVVTERITPVLETLRVWNHAPVPFMKKFNLLSGLASAVNELHQAGYLHRDLTLGSFGQDHEGLVKICSFEKCQKFGSDHASSSVLLRENPHRFVGIDEMTDDRNQDVYDLGVCFCEILSGKVLREDQFRENVIDRFIVDDDGLRDPDLGCPVFADDILSRMLIHDPSQRLSMVDVVKEMSRLREVIKADLGRRQALVHNPIPIPWRLRTLFRILSLDQYFPSFKDRQLSDLETISSDEFRLLIPSKYPRKRLMRFVGLQWAMKEPDPELVKRVRDMLLVTRLEGFLLTLNKKDIPGVSGVLASLRERNITYFDLWEVHKSDDLVRIFPKEDRLVRSLREGIESHSDDFVFVGLNIERWMESIGRPATPLVGWNSVDTGELIARGGQGSVHSGTFGGADVAVKIAVVKKDTEFRDAVVEYKMVSEVCRHPKVVRVFGYSLKEDSLGVRVMMVMELMATDLCSYTRLKVNPDAVDENPNRFTMDDVPPKMRPFCGFSGDLTLFQKFQILQQCCSALEFLHSKKVVHRFVVLLFAHRNRSDIKALNFLLSGNLNPKKSELFAPVVKLADFGFSKEKSSDARESLMTMGRGTPVWTAPEVFRMGSSSQAEYGFPADVYSFAMTIYEVLYGVTPFECSNEEGGVNRFTVIELARKGRRPLLHSLREICPEFAELLEGMWFRDPDFVPHDSFCTMSQVSEWFLANEADMKEKYLRAIFNDDTQSTPMGFVEQYLRRAELPENYFADWDLISLGELMACGNSSRVYSGDYVRLRCAVKETILPNVSALEDCIREYERSRAVACPGVVHVYACSLKVTPRRARFRIVCA